LSVCWLAVSIAALAPSELASAGETLNGQLLADARDARLDRFDFVTACLIAGGVSETGELAELRSRYDELTARIELPSLASFPREELAAELQRRLHREILIGDYHSTASDLRLTIGHGDYNCLSAVAIYWDLCRAAGIELSIWSQPGHVFVGESQFGARIDPGSMAVPGQQEQSGTGKLTHPARQQNAQPVRRITPTQLLGKFYYNRGVQLLQEGEYAEGLTLIRASLALDPADAEARANLLAGINNWAAELAGRNEFAAAGTLIEQGLAIDAEYAPLIANERYVRERIAAQ
jgi:hypothetical protein